MAPSAEAVVDLKPKALDFHDWRFGQANGQTGQGVQKVKNGSGQSNGQYGRPILIKVEKSGKNSWSLKEVTTLKEDGTGALLERESSTEGMMTPPLLPEARGEKMGKGDRAGSLLASLSSSLSGDKAEQRLQKQKSRGRYAWLLLLQAHKAAGCLAWLGMGARTFLRHMRKRLFSEKLDIEESDQELELNTQGEEGEERRRQTSRVSYGLLFTLRMLAALSFLLLAFEVISHSSEIELELQLSNPAARFWPWLTSLVTIHQDWATFRTRYLAPGLQWTANFCTYLFLIQTVDRILLFLGFVWIKIRGLKPVAKGNYEEDADPERPGESYPMVLVQMPMCNEKEVYESSIAACCALEWPRNRFLIQVLDDSSDMEAQKLIEEECAKWAARGVPIKYRHRVDRKGYKAGNLDNGMKYDYVRDFEFVAIFDADFQPKPDFLLRTMPHFKDNPEIALVQARWSFVNKDENLLTKLQNINLAFHFEVEQQVNGIFLNFFGFNGTAGVWRIKALEDSGGWMDRTTVEDMDIAVRAHLKGWKFVYLNDVDAQCELPESYEAYRKQQHRWHSGPMQLFRLCLPDCITAKIPVWKKLNVIFLFFLLRKMILPFYSFALFCIILPVTMFVPEASLPLWVVCYIPGIMSVMNVLPSPRYFPFMIPYLLFENTMSVTKFQAMVAGLFQLKSSHEWVVTKKTGAGTRDLLPGSKSAMNLTTPARQPNKSVSFETSMAGAGVGAGSAGAVAAGAVVAAESSAQAYAASATPKAATIGFFPRTISEPVLYRPGPKNGIAPGAAGTPHANGLSVTIPSVPESAHSVTAVTPGSAYGERSLPPSAGASPREGSPTDTPTGLSGVASRYLPVASKPEVKKAQPRKLYRNELALALLLLVAAGRSLLSVYGMHFYFLLFQGITFLVVGLDLITDRH